jgi:hypothetical protein
VNKVDEKCYFCDGPIISEDAGVSILRHHKWRFIHHDGQTCIDTLVVEVARLNSRVRELEMKGK